MRRTIGPALLIFLGLMLVVLYLVLRQGPADPNLAGAMTPQPLEDSTKRPGLAEVTLVAARASHTPQPIYPTPTMTPETAGLAAKLSPSPSPQPSLTITPDPRRCPRPDCLSRSGVSGRLEHIAAASGAGLPFGNYFDWWIDSEPPLMTGHPIAEQPRYWLMVPVSQDGPTISWSQIEEVLEARSGAIWVVGNEPDVVWQDNTTAETYAAIYHDVYTFINDRDPAAMIAIAGVAQPSPLRFAYLERVLETYQDLYDEAMPVDIWTIHAFILRELDGGWGVGIPPGIDEREGLLYEIADHDDIEIFRQSLIEFRQWMTDQGYGGKPLAVTEFGILHPADYGFPPETVTKFMIDAIDFMATASGDTGDPADDFHLVQQWFWYSVYDDRDFPTGNLYDAELESLTAAGQAFRRYMAGE